MQVLIQTLGSAGDVYPLLALGRGLRERGHRVAVVVNGHFAEATERAGLEGILVGTDEEFRAALANPDLWHPKKGFRHILDGAVFPALGETVDRLSARLTADTVLVGSTLGFAARIVRELHDVPLVTAHLAPVALRTLHRVPRLPGLPVSPRSPRWWKRLWWRILERLSDAAALPGLNAYRARHGLPPAADVFGSWNQSPDGILGLWPEWFAPAQPDWPPRTRLAGFCFLDQQLEPDAALRAWVEEGEPPVVFTHGSAQVHSQAFFRDSVGAAAALGRRALLVVRNRDSVPRDLPASVRHAPYVPFPWLLPRASTLVSHGGIGTCAAALAAGVPHLAAPMAFDQFDNASRLVDLGTGACLPAARYRARRAAALLRRLLDTSGDACRGAAARLAAEDGLSRACEAIERVRNSHARG